LTSRCFGCDPLVPLVSDGQLNSLSFRQRDVRLASLPDDEDIIQSGSEDVAYGILDMNNIEGPRMTLSANNGTNTPQVTTSGDHTQVSRIEFDGIHDLPACNVYLNGVVHFDHWIRVSDSAAIVCHQEWNSLRGDLETLHLAELVLGFLWSDSVNREATFDVIDQTEVLVRLFDLHDIHETSGEGWVSANFAIDFDKALHNDFRHFSLRQSVLQSVPEKYDQRKRLPEFMRSSTWPWSINTTQFVQHPCLRGIQPLQMFLGTTRHD